MNPSLHDQCDECREAILTAILDALHERTDYIASIERTPRGDIPVTGIALELFPWHGGLGLSLRLSSDFPLGRSRYDSADWPHFNFTDGCTSPSISTAIALVTKIYNQGEEDEGEEEGNSLREMAHLTFLAGAKALLDPKVSQLLVKLGIDAPVLADRFVSSGIQFIVIDADQTMKANYCDIVLANRVTERLLKITG